MKAINLSQEIWLEIIRKNNDGEKIIDLMKEYGFGKSTFYKMKKSLNLQKQEKESSFAPVQITKTDCQTKSSLISIKKDNFILQIDETVNEATLRKVLVVLNDI